ncbi:Phosphofructokinase family protein [Trichomonas vaginalis G3]|uniref:Phosphofructokinase family protein n=1 Tax=Trichomonas vaginalis (strain ATCC PRA-98 / G3) TaxID=412133 RepID=A2ENZ7_TRIV3|nr:6-phosphofructokinase protein [Trichomonas vaginalis G3]EAY05601.1 Phosphofructokinase family protein [Trichomonas vaginalis G3]KAI5486841.1 6-phosphofructokinase protein [Trichomonas vaginalis G3]|eukprot:XP_001317824.1 Phosphofructokinase family protein [Trichomonas vaginalis G3]
MFAQIEEPAKDAPILAIICGGTPVPGLNSVIASSTLSALSNGWRVIAFHDGYVHLSTGDPEIVKQNMIELNKYMVEHIQRAAGSIIRCDRFDPTRNPQWVSNVQDMLEYFKVRYCLIIGGTDKVISAHIITQGIDPYSMSVLVIPKTIDNDVCLPYGQSTFGFQSAVQYATQIVKNLVLDTRSVPRWFIVEVSGRSTGHTALHTAIASGAQLAIIPESFGKRKIELSDVLDLLEGAIYKRLAVGKNYGVCIVSEGIIENMSGKSQQQLFSNGYIKYDDDGHVNLFEADLSRALTKNLLERLQARKINVRVNAHKLGPELRGCPPNSFDEVYSKELGFAATEGFRTRHSNAMVVWVNGHIYFQAFRDIMDQNNRIYPRKVNIDSKEYKVGSFYMWNVKKEDLANPEKVKQLANCANMTPEEFKKKYTRIVEKIDL